MDCWIGIVGGGQLARMLAMAAARLGLKTCVLDPQFDCPAAQIANKHIQADYDDMDAMRQLAQNCAVVTYEFENINSATLQESCAGYSAIFPPIIALEISADRRLEKKFFNQNAIATTAWVEITDVEQLCRQLQQWPQGGILKTCRLGYDGYGQRYLSADADKEQCQQALNELSHGTMAVILEKFVKFEREISVILTRDQQGSMVCFDVVENEHKAGILRRSFIPARIDEAMEEQARKMAEICAERLNYVGVLALELFVLPNGQLLVNEMAPRVHNSGHWTEVACMISQFEQHIRAIAGWSLGDGCRHVIGCEMTNIIGFEIEKLPELLASKNISVHLYGKSHVRDGRKMGHFTKIQSYNCQQDLTIKAQSSMNT